MKRLMLLLGAVVFLLSSCGGYYYRATVQGFVVDDESDAGINEATVRIYTSEVTDPADEGFVSSTSTVTQGGNGGYYSSTVIWNNWFGAYGDEGDTTEIWLGITHPDYADRVIKAEGILSDDNNLIATVRLEETTFRLDALRGRVVDSNGAGVNGVRVVLDLPQVSGTDEREDRIVQTATIDGQSGTFEFGTVEWDDTNTSSASGELSAIVRIDDAEWGDPLNTGNPDPEDDEIVEESVVLLPGDQPRTLSGDITVFRLPRSEFTATVSGRVLERLADGTREGVQGVEVTLTYLRDEEGNPDVPVTLITSSNAAGDYQFTITWIDNAPGDFDDADAQTTNPVVRGTVAGIDPGEDGLVIDVAYGTAGGIDFSAGGANLTGATIVSNPAGGVNFLPDNIQ
jgi:hypothetical protein